MKFAFGIGLLASLAILAGCSGEETAAPEVAAEASAANAEAVVAEAGAETAEAPIEGTAFSGMPLYRNPVAAERLEELEALMAPLESRENLSEDQYIELGALYIAANRFRDAIELYTRGIEAHPDSFKLRRHRGHRYINVRELENAIADLREAVDLIGTEHSDALEFNAEGAATGTYEFWTWYHIGLYHYLHGDWAEAAAAYRNCVATATVNQSLVGASDWLYMALRRNGEHEAAEAVIAAIPVDLDTNQEHPYFKRMLMYKGELTAEDLVDIEKPAGEWTGFDVTAGYGIANYLALEGDAASADMILRKIVQTPYWNSWAFVVSDRELAERPEGPD